MNPKPDSNPAKSSYGSNNDRVPALGARVAGCEKSKRSWRRVELILLHIDMHATRMRKVVGMDGLDIVAGGKSDTVDGWEAETLWPITCRSLAHN